MNGKRDTPNGWSYADSRIVSRTGIGVDNVDLDAATGRGIHVTNVPDYCIPEASDHTLAVLLGLERKIVEYNGRSRTASGTSPRDGPSR